jgi:hypothetical protein
MGWGWALPILPERPLTKKKHQKAGLKGERGLLFGDSSA